MFKTVRNYLPFISIPVAVACSNVVFAEEPLRRANVYQSINEVFINETEVSDEERLTPGDLLETGTDSRADMLFNEGTLARAPSNTEFHFRAGTRRFELTDGTALIILQPGSSERSLRTPTAEVTADAGTVFWVSYNPEAKQTRVGVFANPKTSVQVSGIEPYADESVELEAGQVIDIVESSMSPTQVFSLPTFYETSGVADGLRPGDDLSHYPSQMREILETAQENTSLALQEQQKKLQEEGNPSDNFEQETMEVDGVGTEWGEIDVIESASEEDCGKFGLSCLF